MWFSQLLLLCCGVTNTILLVKAVPYCPKQNQTGEPHFTQKLGHVDNVRLSHGVAILCCAEGYDQIRWYRLESSKWKTFPPPPDGDDNTPTLEEDGQILRIHDAVLTDQTSYRCDVEGRTKVIHHITYLNLIECDPLSRGPMPTTPSPENKTIYEYGGNLTFHCTGYFGCQDKGDWSLQLAFWWADGKFVQNLDKRYKVVTLEDRNQFTKQAKFTITDVREEDTKRTFYCMLQNSQEVQGYTKTAVKILKKDKPKIPWLKIELFIGGSVLVVIIIIIIIVCLLCLYGPQIKLFCISRISACGPKTIDKETFQFNLFIYHAEEDETVAQKIKRKLTDCNFEVYITSDMGGNQIVMHTVFEKCRQSALVVLLYSEALKKDEMANFYLQSLITERKGKDIIILEVAHKHNEKNDRSIQAENTNELHAENKIIAQNEMGIDRNENADTELEINRSIAENDGVDGAENVTDDRVPVERENEFVKNWKVLPRLKYPDHFKSKRKAKNFWCSLQNKIPKFDYQKQSSKKKAHNIDRTNSINKPLLDSCRDSEPLTPFSQHGSPGQISPNTDEVFSFGSLDENENSNQEEKNLRGAKTDTAVVAKSVANNLPTPDKNMVRAEIPHDSFTYRGPELICAADVHHAENSNLQESTESSFTSPKTVFQNSNAYVEERFENEPKVMSREEVFTMSDEEPKPGSFESESGYSEETHSGRVTDHTSESCKSSPHELLSYKSSSGVSDLTSEESRSPDNQLYPTHTDICASGYTENPEPVKSFETTYFPTHNANMCLDKEKSEYVKKKTNDKLSLIIKPGEMRGSSSSTPESGYTSTGGFLRKIEGNIDSIAEEL